MCMACEMEAMWFAAMEARARATASETGPPTILPPLPEGETVGEGVTGGTRGVDGEQAAPGARDDSRGELRGPPPDEGGASTAPPRCACEETQAE